MLIKEDVWTAVDKGYEEIAQLQLEVARKSRISGDVDVLNQKQLKSTKLYSYIVALDELSLNHTIEQNKTINKLYNKIKLITKDLRLWD